ncbi:DEAD/DEAH box helicase [Rhizosphaericola mali]|uniref:AAA family ATPase n=1 Tax=Rhizosphaericola mali TaxID=2545455 RepID=A0A5P2FWY0_9BACT|nr:AAA domain-containing protein [Rhizosphaericola mali]QES87695.1 AAA family ATPase [Rhizosphaericola mali]
MRHIFNAILLEKSATQITVRFTEDNKIFTNTIDFPAEFISSISLAEIGEKVHLLHCLGENEDLFAKYVIIEPDFLLDISSIAECIHEYGASPFFYLYNRAKKRANTRPILLGNAANFFLDEIIHASSIENISYNNLLSAFFKRYAVDLSACKDLQDKTQEITFFQDLKLHFEHLYSLVTDIFPRFNINRHAAILEPSFLSPQLGLQGRLDLLLLSDDRNVIIELKSGKAPFPENDYHLIGVNHQAQSALYQAMVQLVLNIDGTKLDTYICYSRYGEKKGLLRKNNASDSFIAKVLDIRNQIVLVDKYFGQNKILPERYFGGINGANMIEDVYLDTRFISNYILPPIEKIGKIYTSLNPLEKAYYTAFYKFIVREIRACKLPSQEIFAHAQSSLWLQNLEEKKADGRILINLQLLSIEILDNGAEILRFQLLENLEKADFRIGDIVVLYQYNLDTDCSICQQVIKGTLLKWQGVNIDFLIRNKQSELALPINALFAAEHDYLDSNNGFMFQSLTEFFQLSKERRRWIFQPNIGINECKKLTHYTSNPLVDNVLLQAKQAKELFLIVGPPGTGKTSIALHNLVKEIFLDSRKDILLVAYTNKAVDEICRAIASITNIDFIRLGTSISCATEFRSHLLENKISQCVNRIGVQNVLANCRIYVGTLAAIQSKSEIFKIKHFDIAIVDEASQILEPHILSLFAAEDFEGKAAIDKFILIGDHKQLPAVVAQDCSEPLENLLIENGWASLTQSYFERIYRQFYGNQQIIGELSMQGRMHEEIASLANQLFYQNQLQCVPLVHQKGTLNYLKIPDNDLAQIIANKRLHFFPYSSVEKDAVGLIANICATIFELYQLNQWTFSPKKTLGIIAPYKDLIAAIRKELHQLGIADLNEIDIDTVERYQGAQKDIILFAFGIENEKQLLQQTSNCIEMDGNLIDRKLNVAITRARKQLFLMGNERFIGQNDIYVRLLELI